MFLNTRRRLITVLFALTSLLFAQLALAGYVCPGLGPQAAEMAEASMPCAEAMRSAVDTEPSTLCHAHCQADQQKPDTHQLPVLVSLPHLGADYLLIKIVRAPPGARSQASQSRRPTSPPLAIQNCCFRI